MHEYWLAALIFFAVLAFVVCVRMGFPWAVKLADKIFGEEEK